MLLVPFLMAMRDRECLSIAFGKLLAGGRAIGSSLLAKNVLIAASTQSHPDSIVTDDTQLYIKLNASSSGRPLNDLIISQTSSKLTASVSCLASFLASLHLLTISVSISFCTWLRKVEF